MKTIIALLISIGLVYSAAVTIGSQSSITISLEIKENSSNSSNVDTVVTLDYPDTFPTLVADAENTAICFRASDSNFTIANSATALTVFAYSYNCDIDGATATCDTADELDFRFRARVGSAGTTDGSGVLATGTTADMTGGTTTAAVNATTNTVVTTTAGITQTEIVANGLPNKTQTQYFKCYSKMTAATGTDFTSSVGTVAATYDATPINATIKGSSASVAAVLAVAGSLLASFAF